MAYLEQAEIKAAMEADPLAGFCAQAVEATLSPPPSLTLTLSHRHTNPHRYWRLGS
jgi:hypothetical protein